MKIVFNFVCYCVGGLMRKIVSMLVVSFIVADVG